MSKRKSSDTKLALNPKKSKLEQIDFAKLKAELDKRTKILQGDHRIWTACIDKRSNTGLMGFNNIMKSAHLWYYLCVEKKADMDDNMKLVKTCSEALCIAHYEAYHVKLGSVVDMNSTDYMMAWKRIEKNVSKQENGCWIWKGGIGSTGYGATLFLGKSLGAHRMTYMLANKCDLKKEQFIRHKCTDTRACVNPDHLEIGDAKENAADRVRDGKQRSKLSDEQVIEIGTQLRSGAEVVDLADQYRMSQTAIVAIKTGKTWSHLFSREELDQMKNLNKAGDGMDVTMVPIDTKIHLQSAPASEDKVKQKLEQKMARLRTHIVGSVDKLQDAAFSSPHWLWKGMLTPTGYAPSLVFQKKHMAAHRVSWIVHNKSMDILDNNLLVRHKCTYKHCVQPDHLETGSYADNGKDRIRDGTSGKGTQNAAAKISEEVAKQIKASKGTGTQVERSKKFNVPLSTVKNIDSGSCWTHI